MKKVLLSLLTLSAVVLVACGPSKAYTTAQTATNNAMEQLATVADQAALAAIQTQWTEAVVDASTLQGDEAVQFTELAATFTSAVQAKADSLNQVALEAAAAAAVADSLAAAAPVETAKK